MNTFQSRLQPIQDAAEEVFELFASARQDAADLGMLAPSQESLELNVGPYDFTITQSPGLLRSDNAQGTTGAAVWQSGVRVSRWLVSSTCALLEAMPDDSTVVELGCGISGIVSTVLASRLDQRGAVLATDMPYAMKGLRKNLKNHQASMNALKSRLNVQTAELNWEADIASSVLRSNGLDGGADLVIACDCIYNYALIQPFLDTCASICGMRAQSTFPTACLVVQQLRQPDVLEEWLEHALPLFNIWRAPHGVVPEDLCEQQGYVVHLLVLR